MSTTATPSNVERQAPTALLAVVQHIHDHDLGVPLSIAPPSTASPFFTIGIVADSIDAWVGSGLAVDVDAIESRPIGGRISGRLWERITTPGRLLPYGIRVNLMYSRPLVEAPRHLAAVADGGAA
ncbi:hypothetical protein [Nocardioides lijunqiniae]|uniref:hypothetical protein n=1 Tax=Nocardioides lijunqiniae TaxID=2760832 RepID=UPI001877D5F6|nr:hypothetical protein [Nocardioides lijunqiniae]